MGRTRTTPASLELLNQCAVALVDFQRRRWMTGANPLDSIRQRRWCSVRTCETTSGSSTGTLRQEVCCCDSRNCQQNPVCGERIPSTVGVCHSVAKVALRDDEWLPSADLAKTSNTTKLNCCATDLRSAEFLFVWMQTIHCATMGELCRSTRTAT